MEPVYTPVIGAALSLFRVRGWKVEVRGAEHIPADGPAVIASNHIGYLDFIFVGYGARDAGRLVRFAAKKEVFDHPVSGPLMRGMKHLPVDRDGDRMAVMREAQRRLGLGQVIGMFPEGTISRSFMPSGAKTGTARMAIEAGVPLIPAAVWGDHRIMTKGRKPNWQRGVHMMVGFGPAVEYDEGADTREVTQRMTEAITDLVTELQRDYPQVPADDEDRWWLPAHLGGTAPTPEEAEAIAREERIARRRARKAAREAEAATAGDRDGTAAVSGDDADPIEPDPVDPETGG